MNWGKLRAPEHYGRVHMRTNSLGCAELRRQLYNLAGEAAGK